MGEWIQDRCIAIVRNPGSKIDLDELGRLAEDHILMLDFWTEKDRAWRVLSSEDPGAVRAAGVYTEKLGLEAERDARLSIKGKNPQPDTIEWMEKAALEGNTLFFLHSPLASMFLPPIMQRAGVPWLAPVSMRRGDLLLGNPFQRALVRYPAKGHPLNYLELYSDHK